MGAEQLEGLIPLAGGIIAYLILYGVIPVRNREALKGRIGRVMQIAAPICIVMGLLRLFGILK